MSILDEVFKRAPCWHSLTSVLLRFRCHHLWMPPLHCLFRQPAVRQHVSAFGIVRTTLLLERSMVFSLCLSFCFPLFSSISFHLHSWTPREATSHFVEWIRVCVYLIWGRNCLHFSFSYFICTIIDCFCPHANVRCIECVCFESLERPNTHTSHETITEHTEAALTFRCAFVLIDLLTVICGLSFCWREVIICIALQAEKVDLFCHYGISILSLLLQQSVPSNYVLFFVFYPGFRASLFFSFLMSCYALMCCSLLGEINFWRNAIWQCII